MGFLSKITEQHNCDICGKKGNKILMQTLKDGKICQDCFNKLGSDRFTTKYTVHDAMIKIGENTFNTNDNVQNCNLQINVSEYEMGRRRDKYIFTAKYKRLSDNYYKDLTRIDTLWSTLYNINDFNGSYAKNYEELCLKNINAFKQIYDEFCIPYKTVEFSCVPAYKRLSMLYEKQKRYKEAVMVCIDAIQHGVPNEYGDGGSGKMYARLARMAKKAEMLDNPEVKFLITGK